MNKSYLIIVFVSCCVLNTTATNRIKISSEHPRLILSRADINMMKANVLKGDEPWKSTWTELKGNLDKFCVNNKKTNVYFGDVAYTFYETATTDGSMARDLAIGYHISGNKLYADEAIKIIRSWITPKSLPGKYFDPKKYYPNTGMMVSRGVFPFIYAYDLLCADNLVDEETERLFEKWLKTLLPHIVEGQKRWKDNDYFDKQYFQNHIVADAVGLMSIGVILRDKKMVGYAVDCVKNKRDIKDIIEGIILMEGQQPYYREPVERPAQTGEIMDRYRHYEIEGQWEDYVTKPNRALQYSGLSTTLLVIAAEIGRLNGFDLYNWKASTGEEIKLPLIFYADFYIEKDASIKGGFYTGETSWINNNSQSTFALWEIANARYPNTEKFIEVLKSNIRGSQELNLLGPVTLTHGR